MDLTSFIRYKGLASENYVTNIFYLGIYNICYIIYYILYLLKRFHTLKSRKSNPRSFLKNSFTAAGFCQDKFWLMFIIKNPSKLGHKNSWSGTTRLWRHQLILLVSFSLLNRSFLTPFSLPAPAIGLVLTKPFISGQQSSFFGMCFVTQSM